VSNKIERLSVWNRKNGVAALESHDLSFTDALDVTNSTSIEEYPMEIRTYTAKAVWTCPQVLLLDYVVSDDTLAALKKLTGCVFAKNLNEQKIYIGHPLESGCQVAIAKLNIILKYSVCKGLA
jgi:hypothetical protein